MVTDDLANHVFSTPVAEDFCSSVDLVVEEVYSQGACPLAETIVRTIQGSTRAATSPPPTPKP